MRVIPIAAWVLATFLVGVCSYQAGWQGGVSFGRQPPFPSVADAAWPTALPCDEWCREVRERQLSERLEAPTPTPAKCLAREPRNDAEAKMLQCYTPSMKEVTRQFWADSIRCKPITDAGYECRGKYGTFLPKEKPVYWPSPEPAPTDVHCDPDYGSHIELGGSNGVRWHMVCNAAKPNPWPSNWQCFDVNASGGEVWEPCPPKRWRE